MSWFDRFRRRGRSARGSGTPAPGPEALADITAFLETRGGVEIYVEPPTAVEAMSVCLVAADGEYLRRPVKNAKQANRLAVKHGVPIYDARIVGYPRRMRDYDRGVRRSLISLEDLPPLEITDRPEE